MRFAAQLTTAMFYTGAVEATPRIYPPIPTIANHNDNMLDLTGSYALCVISCSFLCSLLLCECGFSHTYCVLTLVYLPQGLYCSCLLFFLLPADDKVSVVTPQMKYLSESEIALKQLHELEVLHLFVITFFRLI